ncbi:MAG: hypothetical protein WBM00_03720 [Solirubrobacterales bacterium]
MAHIVDASDPHGNGPMSKPAYPDDMKVNRRIGEARVGRRPPGLVLR